MPFLTPEDHAAHEAALPEAVIDPTAQSAAEALAEQRSVACTAFVNELYDKLRANYRAGKGSMSTTEIAAADTVSARPLATGDTEALALLVAAYPDEILSYRPGLTEDLNKAVRRVDPTYILTKKVLSGSSIHIERDDESGTSYAVSSASITGVRFCLTQKETYIASWCGRHGECDYECMVLNALAKH